MLAVCCSKSPGMGPRSSHEHHHSAYLLLVQPWLPTTQRKWPDRANGLAGRRAPLYHTEAPGDVGIAYASYSFGLSSLMAAQRRPKVSGPRIVDCASCVGSGP